MFFFSSCYFYFFLYCYYFLPVNFHFVRYYFWSWFFKTYVLSPGDNTTTQTQQIQGPMLSINKSSRILKMSISEKFYTKGLTRQVNRRMKGQITNSGPQNIKQKNKDWATQTPLKSGVELRFLGMVSSHYSTNDICRFINVKNQISHGRRCEYDKWNTSVVNL